VGVPAGTHLPGETQVSKARPRHPTYGRGLVKEQSRDWLQNIVVELLQNRVEDLLPAALLHHRLRVAGGILGVKVA
jgi:hypothetical protein